MAKRKYQATYQVKFEGSTVRESARIEADHRGDALSQACDRANSRPKGDWRVLTVDEKE